MTESFVGRLTLIRDDGKVQCFQSDGGDCYHLYTDHRNPNVKVGEKADIYFRSTPKYGVLFSK